MTNILSSGRTVFSTTLFQVQTDSRGPREVSIYILFPGFSGVFEGVDCLSLTNAVEESGRLIRESFIGFMFAICKVIGCTFPESQIKLYLMLLLLS